MKLPSSISVCFIWECLLHCNNDLLSCCKFSQGTFITCRSCHSVVHTGFTLSNEALSSSPGFASPCQCSVLSVHLVLAAANCLILCCLALGQSMSCRSCCNYLIGKGFWCFLCARHELQIERFLFLYPKAFCALYRKLSERSWESNT